MIYFAFLREKVIFLFHLKGGGTSFKHYVLNEHLRKEFPSIDLDKYVKKNGIHNTLRKIISTNAKLKPVGTNSQVKTMIDKYHGFHFVHVHRNYKDRIVSGFYNKCVDLDGNGHIFTINNPKNIPHVKYTFNDLIDSISKNKHDDYHFIPQPKFLKNIKRTVIDIKNYDKLNSILVEHGLPAMGNIVKNKANVKLVPITKKDLPSGTKKISIGLILDLKAKGKYIPYDMFYTPEISAKLKPFFGHEICDNFVIEPKKKKEDNKIAIFVPIKLNSQRLPNKMLLPLGNKKLCQHIFDTLLKTKENISPLCPNIEIYCYCSDESIKTYLPEGIKFLQRDPTLDKDETKGMDIYTSFAKGVEADIYCLTHATSPFIKVSSIESGLKNVLSGEYDSSFSVSRVQTFCWYNNSPLNYSLDNVVRTQDIKPVMWETSAFYIFRSDVLNVMKKRIGNKPYLVETDRIESVDIDEQEDYDLAIKIVS